MKAPLTFSMSMRLSAREAGPELPDITIWAGAARMGADWAFVENASAASDVPTIDDATPVGGGRATRAASVRGMGGAEIGDGSGE